MLSGLLGGLTPQAFLDRHWQKEPLLVRGAVPATDAGVSRAELFGLACQSDVCSRLIELPCAREGWKVRRGPFEASALDRLPAAGWTLLVQEVDRHLPAMAALVESFRFIPNWRIDDVMVSYAPDGAGVGPHIDRYDVFLLQGQGRRRWRIASRPPADTPLVSGTELPVLAEFRPDRDWLLEPGDMLYLPPGIPHEGTAVSECVTCSIGFRVPDPRELCAGYLRQLAPRAFDAIRYRDPDRVATERPGEIPADARRRLMEDAVWLFNGRKPEFDHWIGRSVTSPLRGSGPVPVARIESPAELRDRIACGEALFRSAPSHFAWYRDDGSGVQLFVGGEHYPMGPGRELEAELLCGRRPLDRGTLGAHLESEGFLGILTDLVLRGYLRPQAPGTGKP